ncbi:hypothetical protein BKA81DRAFT_54339 [Phyllosticta paracitricarpa]
MQGAGAFFFSTSPPFPGCVSQLAFFFCCLTCFFVFFSSFSSSLSLHQSHHLRILLARVRKKHGLLLRYTATPCISAVAFRGPTGEGRKRLTYQYPPSVCPSIRLSVRCPGIFSFFVLLLFLRFLRSYSAQSRRDPSPLFAGNTPPHSLPPVPHSHSACCNPRTRPCPCSALVILYIHCERSPWCCVGSVLSRIPHPPAVFLVRTCVRA